MSKIRITSEQVRKNYPRANNNLVGIALTLKSQILIIVEDAFVLSKNKTKMDNELEKEWNYFKRILENRL